MKKLSKLLALAVSVVAFGFVSCADGDVTGTAAVGTNDQTSTTKDYSVSFVSANGESLNLESLGISDEESSSKSARTIYDTGVAALGTGWEFYLWGTDEVKAATINPKKVTFTADASDTSGSTGKVALDLGSSKYKLVLAAVKGSTTETTADGIKGKATYIGYANVDTRTTSSIKFVISSDGLSGESEVTLTVKFDGYDSNATSPGDGSWADDDVDAVKNGTYGSYTISASIQNRATGAALASATSPISATDFFGTSGAAYSATVQAGTYNFVVSFTNATSGKTYEYSDTIIVLANNPFSQTVLVPDVIETAPKAPENFKVGYIEPDSVKDGEYNAVLHWDDASTNEKYFRIEIWDLPDTAPEITAAINDKTKWNAEISGITTTNLKEYEQDFYGNINKGWVSGSLLKNNENVVLKLSLGHKYIMRIAALNDAVDKTTANYAYATYDLGAAAAAADDYTSADTAYDNGKTYSPLPFYLADKDETEANAYKKNTTVANFANLYRLTYHLNGGTLTLDSSVAATTDDVVAYLTQDVANGVAILEPFKNPAAVSPATATYPGLIKLTNRWTSWRTGQVEGTLYPYDDTTSNPVTDTTEGVTYYAPNKYKGYANLDLFASYAVAAADVERYDDAKYAFADGEVYFTVTTGKVEKTNDHAYTIKAGAGQVNLNYYFDKITDSAKKKAANVAYTSLRVSVIRSGTKDVVVTGDFSASTTTRSVQFDSTPLSEGKYRVEVTGTYNGHIYTYVIIMTVES
ncbi:MAG: hypothetical protein IJ727_04925 [Treponema sp.]|nr:hypothetical protein [Treponema sp.]